MTKTKAPLKVALYARVSTDSQTTENQLQDLREAADRHGWTVAAEFVDHGISGAKGRDQRPQLDAMLKGIARKDFDLVAAWSVDRLGRSLVDLVGMLQELHSKGLDLYLHKQGIDTTTPAGRAMFGMMGVFAEFEREMIRERVNAGIARVRVTGKNKHGEPVKLGRPTIDKDKAAQIRDLHAQGMGLIKIGRTVGCGTSAVQRVLASA
jgi:DNA invertase Pin-like site-specific DNA recombinase